MNYHSIFLFIPYLFLHLCFLLLLFRFFLISVVPLFPDSSVRIYFFCFRLRFCSCLFFRSFLFFCSCAFFCFRLFLCFLIILLFQITLLFSIILLFPIVLPYFYCQKSVTDGNYPDNHLDSNCRNPQPVQYGCRRIQKEM